MAIIQTATVRDVETLCGFDSTIASFLRDGEDLADYLEKQGEILQATAVRCSVARQASERVHAASKPRRKLSFQK